MVPNVLAEHQAPPLQMFYYWQWLMTTISILLRCATVLRIINYLTYIQCSAFAAEATPLQEAGYPNPSMLCCYLLPMLCWLPDCCASVVSVKRAEWQLDSPYVPRRITIVVMYSPSLQMRELFLLPLLLVVVVDVLSRELFWILMRKRRTTRRNKFAFCHSLQAKR